MNNDGERCLSQTRFVYAKVMRMPSGKFLVWRAQAVRDMLRRYGIYEHELFGASCDAEMHAVMLRVGGLVQIEMCDRWLRVIGADSR